MHAASREGLRIRRIGRIVAMLAVATAVLATLATALPWADERLVREVIAPQLGLGGRPLALGPGSRILGCLTALGPLAFLIAALVEVARLFSDFAGGRIFEARSARRVRRIGMAVLAVALLAPLAAIAQRAILTSGNPQGQRLVAVSLELADLVTLVAGLGLVAFAAVMREAARLAEENRGFV